MLLLLILLACFPAGAARVKSGETAPDFALKSVQGENLRLSEYRGQVVLLSIWATWCGRCRDQLPALGQLDQRYRDSGLKVLSIGLDEEREHLLSADRDNDFPILHDGSKRIARLYDAGKLPMTLLIDRHGEVRHVHQGFRQEDVEQYVAQLEAMLAE
jgi:peroxiredoxin